MKTLHISIPKPCSENWDEMTPAEKGRFCAACQKTVIDFTQKTPAEIVAILRNSQEKLCGHFRKDQLGFYPLPEVPEPALLSLRHSFSWQKWAAMLSALVVWQGTPAFSQNADSLNAVQVEKKKDREISSTQWIIKGKIVDKKTKKPIVAHINIKETNLYNWSDEQGNFAMYLDNMPSKDIYFVIIAEGGYESKEIKIKYLSQETLLIKLTKNKYKKTTRGLIDGEISSSCGFSSEITGALTTAFRTEIIESIFGKLDSQFQHDTLKPEHIFHSVIEFKPKTIEFTENTYIALDEIAQFLTINPNFRVDFLIHTDQTPSATEGNALSVKRGQIIYDYLINKGIASQRLTATGYGNSRPLPTGNVRKQERVDIRVWIEEE